MALGRGLAGGCSPPGDAGSVVLATDGLRAALVPVTRASFFPVSTRCRPHPKTLPSSATRASTPERPRLRRPGRTAVGRCGRTVAGERTPFTLWDRRPREVDATWRVTDPSRSAALRATDAHLGAPAASWEPGTRERVTGPGRGPQRPPTRACCLRRDKRGRGPRGAHGAGLGSGGRVQNAQGRGPGRPQASPGGAAPGAGPLPTAQTRRQPLRF